MPKTSSGMGQFFVASLTKWGLWKQTSTRFDYRKMQSSILMLGSSPIVQSKLQQTQSNLIRGRSMQRRDSRKWRHVSNLSHSYWMFHACENYLLRFYWLISEQRLFMTLTLNAFTSPCASGPTCGLCVRLLYRVYNQLRFCSVSLFATFPRFRVFRNYHPSLFKSIKSSR